MTFSGRMTGVLHMPYLVQKCAALVAVVSAKRSGNGINNQKVKTGSASKSCMILFMKLTLTSFSLDVCGFQDQSFFFFWYPVFVLGQQLFQSWATFDCD